MDIEHNTSGKQKNVNKTDSAQLRMASSYPVFSSDSHIHIAPTGAWLLFETKDNPHWNWGITKLTHHQSEAIFLCDGTRSMEDIYKIISHENNEQFAEEIFSFIEAMVFKGVLTLSKNPVKYPSYASYGGTKDFYVPLHGFLELTDCCNQLCKHCYRNSGPENSIFADTQSLLNVIEQLSSLGTLVCEITGGEPLLHPDFKSIIESCANNFEVVSLITNGYLIDNEISDFIEELRSEGCMILASVTLNSYDTNFHDAFAGINGSFNNACQAISMLSSRNILVRATMNIVPGNIDHLRQTAELALSLGAEAFTSAFIMPFGRGSNIDWSGITKEDIHKYEKEFTELKRKYPLQIVNIPEAAFDVIEAPNCGAGSRSIAISPSGAIRPCVTLEENYHLGNIFQQTYKECLSNPLSEVFEAIPAPNDQSCSHCELFGFCNRCYLRALIASKNIKQCNWRSLLESTHQFDEIIKKTPENELGESFLSLHYEGSDNYQINS